MRHFAAVASLPLLPLALAAKCTVNIQTGGDWAGSSGVSGSLNRGCAAEFTGNAADNDNCENLASFTPHIGHPAGLTSALPWVTIVEVNDMGLEDGYAKYGALDLDFHGQRCKHSVSTSAVDAFSGTVCMFDC